MSNQDGPQEQSRLHVTLWVYDQAQQVEVPLVWNSEGGGIPVTLPASVVTNIATIATNTGTIATQTTNIATSTATIATQTTTVATNTGTIATNTGNIRTDTSSIATSSATMATQQTTMATQQTTIATQTTTIATNTGTSATNIGTVATNISTQNSYDSVYAIAGAFGGNGAYATILTAGTNYKRAVITLTEQTGTARTYRLRHTSGAVVIYRAFNLAISANAGHIFSGFAIKSGDVIECQSSSASSVYCSIEGA